VYKRQVRTCAELGLFSELITPPETVTTEEMLDLVAALNARDEIDGILIQLPLPRQVDTKALLDAVSPLKDVDGFHPVNAGRLQANRPALAPCTPAGIIEILQRSGIPIAGQHAVVVGRSDIVGKPAAMLLLHQNATVTICHSKTRNLAEITRQADILVAAIGRPGFITPEMVTPGATLIDVGINRITGRAEFDRFFWGDAKREATFAKRGSTLVGDIDPKAYELAGAYTPVPLSLIHISIRHPEDRSQIALPGQRGSRQDKHAEDARGGRRLQHSEAQRKFPKHGRENQRRRAGIDRAGKQMCIRDRFFPWSSLRNNAPARSMASM